MRKLPFLIAGASLLICFSAQAADWPQWGGSPCKNMVSQETNLPESFVPGVKSTQGAGIDLATTKNVKWVVRLGDFACGTPAVAGGKVFIGSMIGQKGVLNCFDEATGKLLWQWIKPCRSDLKEDPTKFGLFSVSRDLGVCSTPTVEGDRLYFVDHNIRAVCLDVNGRPPAPGATVGEAKEIWTFDMYGNKNVGSRPSDASNGSPLIDRDLLYVPTSNGIDRWNGVALDIDSSRQSAAPDAPNLIVLDKHTGRLLARDATPIAANILHGQWSSPSMGEVNGRKLIFFGGGDGTCYAFQALATVPKEPVTLKTAWWIDCIPPEYRLFKGMASFVHYCLGDQRRKETLNTHDGTFKGMSEIIGTPVFYNNRVYVAIGRDPEHGRGRGALVCADATKTGDITQTGKIWTYQGLDRSLSTVSIADGLLYIADVAGRLHCLDAETGAVQWIFESGRKTVSSTLVADGKVYFLTEGHLHILAAGKQLKLLSTVNLGAPSWVTPVAANGTVYIASRNYLWALKQ